MFEPSQANPSFPQTVLREYVIFALYYSETNVVRAMGHLRSIVPATVGQWNPDVTLAVGYVTSCAWSPSKTNSRRCRLAVVVSILRTTITGRLEWYALNVPNQSKQSLRGDFSSAISKCFVGGGSVTYCDFDECHIAAPKIFSYANGIVKGREGHYYV